MSDIREWLEELGLGQYAEALAENAIDLETLPHVSDADLKDLGVALGHHRIDHAAQPQPQSAQPEPRTSKTGDAGRWIMCRSLP